MAISQEELAERAGLHRTYVCDIERGARNVSLKSIDKLAKALEVSASTLFSQASETSEETAPGAMPHVMVDILLVEDDEADARLTIEALRKANMTNRIHVVHDGAEALDYLFPASEPGRLLPLTTPQLILLDLHLPKVSGTEVLERIKADVRTRAIPVIVLTASESHRDISASRQLGADGYLMKPVDFQRLSEVTAPLRLQWALLTRTGP